MDVNRISRKMKTAFIFTLFLLTGVAILALRHTTAPEQSEEHNIEQKLFESHLDSQKLKKLRNETKPNYPDWSPTGR